MKRFALGTVCLALAACAANEGATPAGVMLSPEGARHLSARYSPDGSHLAYWSPRTDSLGGEELWVAGADLSAPKALGMTAVGPFSGGGPIVWTPDGKSVFTWSTDFGFVDVAQVAISGGAPKRITDGPGVEVPLALHPDGDHLYYYGTIDASILTYVKSLTQGTAAPAVPGETRPNLALPSPDGKHVAYMVVDGPKTTVWVADLDGKNARQLTTDGFEGLQLASTPWSPDGKWIAYESRRTGTSDIWIVSVDGGTLRQITRDVRNDMEPSWSADGKWIAFYSDRGRQRDVWLVSVDGGGEVRVTDSPAEEAGVLQWRPGTQELLMSVGGPGGGLWVSDLSAGTERRLTSDTVGLNWYEVSPDGREVLYTTNRGGMDELMVVELAGGEPRLLLGGGNVNGAYWSPDGKRIVFASDRGGSTDVWVMDAAREAPRGIVTWPGAELGPRWSSDGKWVYFVSDRDARLGDLWRVSPDSGGGEAERMTTDGTLGTAVGRPGGAELFLQTLSPKGGRISISVLGSDGKLRVLWDKSNAFVQTVSRSGDSVVATVERADGKSVPMILSTRTGLGRPVGDVGTNVLDWSPDGESLLASVPRGGARDLVLINRRDGTRRALMATPETESGGLFTPDGKSVVFRRSRTSDRLMTVDLSKVMAGGGK